VALFSKKTKKEERLKDVEDSELKQEPEKAAGSSAFLNTGSTDTHKILRGFYVSEKSSIGNSANQYTFKVFNRANKSEIKKEVSKLFNVKVKSVKIINMPEKRRDFGRHPGVKSGFKKAVVVLKEGYTIGQAKP